MSINTHRSLLIYGAMGSGKTSLIEQIAAHVCTAGQKARLVTAEHYSTIEDAIEEGLVEVWKVNTRDHPFETLRFAVDGFWPADVLDPTSPLIPPTPETWITRPVRFFEGIATFADYITGSYAKGGLTERAETERIGFEKEYIQFTDGETSIAGKTWTYFRIGQNELTDLINRSMKYPGLTGWTSHEDFSKDRRKITPEVIGTALNSDIGRYFADVLHIATVPVDFTDAGGEMRRITERRLYLREHYIPGGAVPYIAKNSVGLKFQDRVPDYLAMTKDGMPRIDVAERLFRLWGREFRQ